MKYCFYFTVFLLFGCDPPALYAPALPQMTWMDVETKSDTIITNSPVLYYASKNWQQATDTSFSHGYRSIAIRFGDSILVKPLTDTTANYNGPFLLQFNNTNDTLRAQNFLDSVNTTVPKVFIRLK